MKKKIIAAVLITTMMTSVVGMSTYANSSLSAYDLEILDLTNEEQGTKSPPKLCIQCPEEKTIAKDWSNICNDKDPSPICIAKKGWFLTKTGLGKFNSALDMVGNFSRKQQSTLLVLSMFPWIARGFYYRALQVKTKLFPRKQVEPDQAMKNLDEGFKKVKGQEEQKKKMRKVIDGIIGKKQMAKIAEEKYKRGDVIYLVGPSGVGKTFSADILAKALMGKYKPFVLTPANVDLESKDTIIDQLFGLNNSFMHGGNEGGSREPSNLVQYLKLNKNGVIIINEYDKMYRPGLDEVLRTIMDEGEVNIKGQKIDCSGAVFVITSNESTNSAKGGNLDIQKTDDGTGSRTYIKHDKAFMNRVNLVEFDNLIFKDYKEIARDTFEGIASNFEKLYGMKVNVEGIIEEAAKRAEKINQGSRPIVDDMSNGLIQILINKRRETIANMDSKDSKDYVVNVSYDMIKDEFKLTQVDKEGKVVNTTTEGVVFQEELDEKIKNEAEKQKFEGANKEETISVTVPNENLNINAGSKVA